MFIIRHTSWLSSHCSPLKMGLYFRVAFSVNSKSASSSFFIPFNTDFCIAITSIVSSFLLWKLKILRCDIRFGNVAPFGIERQYLAVYVCHKAKNRIPLLGYPIFLKYCRNMRCKFLIISFLWLINKWHTNACSCIIILYFILEVYNVHHFIFFFLS